MPDQIDANGLQTATQAELDATLDTSFETIYGADINLDSDSPDGQIIGDFVQAGLDVRDLLKQINAQFDPDQATGVTLDQRVTINGIQRQGGTNTTTPVQVTISGAVTLQGLDDFPTAPFTIADAAGNNWQLQDTVNLSNGSYPFTATLTFQAENPGAALVTPNTITVPVTIVLGVTTVNNPSTGGTVTGQNEETDTALRIRRKKSVSIGAQGYLAALYAALANVSGITFSNVIENLTGSPKVYGADTVPGHCIWVIVAGSGTAANIAQAIYLKRNAGCNMYGQQVFTITQVDGSPFVVSYDVVTNEALYVEFSAVSIDGVNAPNVAAILSGLATLLEPGVNVGVNVTALGAIVQQIDQNTLVTAAGFSTTAGGTYTSVLNPSSPKYQFTPPPSTNIFVPSLDVFSITLNPTATHTFVAANGRGTYAYSIAVNNSGGSINSSTGVYTAGTTPAVDTIEATDSNGNVAQAFVTVA